MWKYVLKFNGVLRTFWEDSKLSLERKGVIRMVCYATNHVVFPVHTHTKKHEETMQLDFPANVVSQNS